MLLFISHIFFFSGFQFLRTGLNIDHVAFSFSIGVSSVLIFLIVWEAVALNFGPYQAPNRGSGPP